ncbi:carbohydrate ABC transporter substrate-binding protein (CUT1 family) [Sediminihabitans luteus]|uniref:Carbohydrate ABC transporter substrate-binding protein (CUT1 family) n=1 Tax=Sediminihabitans luteus TaxID=1138585 RepID=A0A2M9D173_9CELL|nr:extracellular solute-binding protein [Sediminihabitans luteus]PJJ77961.1 carbohydrate ABC transporter substrate-binding protein (CUT1 family) [Sediminihabitans luteus]GIJ00590.1 ABC transporter substrate-binding protein [Sediminihabitans luteus]
MIMKSLTRRRVAVTAALSTLALGLAACSSGSSDDASAPLEGEVSGDITLLTPIFEGTAGQKLLEDELLPKFYEEYPDVTVSVDYTTYGNLNEKLTTAAVSGAVPDVMMMGVGWIEGFAERGLLADLSDLGLTEDELLKSYTPAIVDAGTWDGGVYAVPIMLDTRFGVARMDLLKEAGYDAPPQTWDELVEMAQALTVRDDKGTLERTGFDIMSLDSRQAFETMLFSADGDLFDDDDTAPAFNGPEGTSALQLMTDLVNEYKVEDIGFSSTDEAVNPLLNGRAAMGIAHNNLWTQGLEADPEMLDNLEPFIIQGDGQGMFFGGTLATRSATSKNPEAAQALLEFLASPDAALAANEQRGNVPALTELLDSDYVQGNRFVQFAMENLDVAKREGGPAEWLEVRGDFAPAVESALLGQKEPQDALDDLAGLVQTAIDR